MIRKKRDNDTTTRVTRVLTAAAVLLTLCASAQCQPVVNTTAGPVEGLQSTNFTAYLGIPYANAGRWEVPEDPSPWVEPFQANQYGPVCWPGAGTENNFGKFMFPLVEELFETSNEPWNIVAAPENSVSEDCLSINVYSPNATATGDLLPVMVWIYGGGFMLGDGNGFTYPPTKIVEQGVVLVTFNYRLGPLGFFAHPDLDGLTNFALYDQVKALEWVQRNIEEFGGDPDNVTIFGESAGGTSVAALLVSPLSEGLFHGAIIESMPAGIESQNTTVEDISAQGVVLGEAMGIPEGPDQLQAMKASSPESVIESQAAPGNLPWVSFYIDGKTSDSDPLTGILDGRNHKVPVIVGNNANECGGQFFMGPGDTSPLLNAAHVPALQQYIPTNTTEKYEGLVRAAFDDETADQLLDLYPSSSPVKSSQAMCTDTSYTVQAWMIASAMADRGEDVRIYHFTQQPEGEAAEILGSFHGSEMPYVGILNQLSFPIANQDLASVMNAYWTNFAKAGDPNADGLPEWESMPANATEWFILGPDVGPDLIPEEKLSLLKPHIHEMLNIDQWAADNA